MRNLLFRYIIWRNDTDSSYYSDHFKKLMEFDKLVDDDVYTLVRKMRMTLSDGPLVDRLGEPVNNLEDAKRMIAISAKVAEHIGVRPEIRWEESFTSLFRMIEKYFKELRLSVYGD
ncbi:anti-apoptotic bcl-2-like protein [Raccoonpox virus]|uniref:Anti-apoptotic Bcl-2-like protein n=1 Tax=Raccoon poxvirus TaxID=10256 RepID=A0A0G3FXJ3_RACVI|nr:Anti-apoptotic Bcl-2-like protein [Raccoonpox virus]AKJ93658.1 Anti-apoptotic Bcl-2-like protein [Raccoonpox virus]AOP31289.1 anti-apoptotic bcl-2-like protein [Raccoonpox virus]